MHLRTTLFGLILPLFFLGSTCYAVYLRRRARRAAGRSWEDLVAMLVAVDRHSIALIASSQLDEGEEVAIPGPELEPQEIWDLVGGMQGLEALGQNCGVLIELACMVQGTYPEALVVAEQLRLNAREIQWHVVRLRDSTKDAETLHEAFPHYAERAATIYFRMTRSVLALYEAAGMPAYPLLQRAL